MSFRKRIALSLPAPTGSVADTIAMARQAEGLGYDDVWLADAGGLDAFTLAPMLLGATEKLRLGIAVVPAYTRTPAVMASTLAVIQQAYPGRFVPGFGTSSHAIVEGWHGLTLEKPLTRMRETVTLLRAMLAGEKTDFSGETLRSRGYRQAPSEPLPPIYLAALRSKMIETAAEIADGVILNLFPRSALSKIMEHVAIGAERGGKDPADVEVVCRHMVVVTGDRAAARDAFRAGFVGYYATPVYNKFLEWAGYEDAAAGIREGWAAKDRERTAAALPDELVDEIAVIGSPDECRELMRWYADSGIHTNIISCIYPTPDIMQATTETFAAGNFSF
jgi:probable F420-dependent oxidoreductase